MKAKLSFFLLVGIFLGLLFLFFSPVLVAGKVLAPLDILDHLMRPWSDGSGGFGVHNPYVYDAISQYLPYDWAVFQSIRNDGFIGWNPCVFGGYALQENTMLCPGDWHHILYAILPFWTAWNVGIVLQFAIAGIGVLMMLRSEKIDGEASLVGAIAYAFYSQHVTWVFHRWVLGASCWFPWIVWAVRRARRKHRVLDVSSILVTTLALRGGHLQACLFTATLLMCLFLSEWLQQDNRWRPSVLASTILPYVFLGACAAVLFLDVFLNTVQPWRLGCKELNHVGPLRALLALPSLGATLFPSLFGSPQTFDATKLVSSDSFDIKFAGAVPFLLAFISLFRKDSPLLPKLLFLVGIIIPFTPLVTWFYSRCSVLFGLGCAWLSAWHLSAIRETRTSKGWRMAIAIPIILCLAWCVGGVCTVVFQPKILAYLDMRLPLSIPPNKISRTAWLLSRAHSFVKEFPPWSVAHLPGVVFVALGLYCAWRTTHQNGTTTFMFLLSRWMLPLCIFAEMFLFARSWISMSPRPETRDSLYDVHPWAEPIVKEMAEKGFMLVEGKNDFDFSQVNTQSGFGIMSVQGYETITPKHIAWESQQDLHDCESVANLGISHILFHPDTSAPDFIAKWMPVVTSKAYLLYRNPAFQSRFLATLMGNRQIPIIPSRPVSPNRIVLSLPKGTIRVSIAQTFHRNWVATLNESRLCPSVVCAPNNTTEVVFSKPTDKPDQLTLAFHPGQSALHIAQFVFLAGILFVSLTGKRKKCSDHTD